MTFREIMAAANAQLEAAIQTKEPARIAVAVLAIIHAVDMLDDDTADDLLGQTDDLLNQILALYPDIDFVKPRQ